MNMDKIKTRMEDEKYKKLNITTSDDSEPYVFVSYKSDDWQTALTKIVYELQQRYGLRVYFDRDFDEKNALWTEEFQKAMGSPKCKAVLVFLSKSYCASYATLMELMFSQTKICMVNRVRKPIIPIIMDSNFQNDLDMLLSNEEDSGLKLEGNERLLFDRCFDQMCVIANKEPGLDIEVLNTYVKQMRLEKRICAQFIEAIVSFSRTNFNIFMNNNEFYEKLALTINDAVNTTKSTLQDEVSVFNHLFKENSEEINKYIEEVKEETQKQKQESKAIDMNLQEAARDVTYSIPEFEINQSNANEFYDRGLACEFGRGVDVHYAKAFAYYVLAAQRGIKEAWFRMGYAYNDGKGVTQNYLKARYWYIKASEELNDKYAQLNLGIFYEFGRGVAKNFTTSIEFYEKSAMQHLEQAMYRLSFMYQDGYKDGKGMEDAFALMQSAAEAGYQNAYIQIANLYREGKGTQQNDELAFPWYEKASALNNSDADYYLGYYYEQGIGVKKDYLKAMYYYKKSSDANNPKAKERIIVLGGQGATAVKDKVVSTSSTLLKKASEVDVDATLDDAKAKMQDMKGKFGKMFNKSK